MNEQMSVNSLNSYCWSDIWPRTSDIVIYADIYFDLLQILYCQLCDFSHVAIFFTTVNVAVPRLVEGFVLKLVLMIISKLLERLK